jgi:hypothetical protein
MSIGREKSVSLAITVSSGSGTGQFTNSWDHVNRIRIVPIAETDTYKCSIKDANGRIIVGTNLNGKTTAWTGTFPVRGPYSLGILKTVEITNASSNGTYYAILDFH